MSLRVVFSPHAWDDFVGWLGRDPKMARRIGKLVADVRRDPFGIGIGKPEKLSGTLSGWSSRRIDHEHRLVYQVRGDELWIAACFGHYDDK
ncbi:Txe/YoeB family addiction module toxin [Actinoplanes sp. RD1]|uniref:Txe/YoeB family addiction module toxin n=1 Tax=Actinoplanes sp. RD1 TaxID=3064538 RepID=UPI0027425E63|nr:Txe/YoeB family addiction module toxin [Actinoplanes sp. RD1]